MSTGAPDDALFPERFVPGEMHGLIEAEHLTRYYWAAACVSGLRVLDAGCGSGYGSLLLHAAGAASVMGVDIAEEAVDTARERGADSTHERNSQDIEFVVGDISALPFEDGFFDVAVCFEAIEHVHDQARALDELRRVLTPAGLLIVSSPNRDVYQEGNPHHTHEYTPEELRSALDVRFANVRLERQQAWLTSMACNDATLHDTDPDRSLAVEVRKVAALAPGQETFTLALASDTELPAPGALATITDLGELHAWRKRARSAEEHLERSNQATADATAIYASAHADYAAAQTSYKNALSALERSQKESERCEQNLNRTNVLLAERNAALRIATDELTRLRTQTLHLDAELSAASGALATLTNSRSWQLTAPLRRLGRAFRRILR